MTKKIEMPVPRDPLMKKILWVVLFLCVVGAVAALFGVDGAEAEPFAYSPADPPAAILAPGDSLLDFGATYGFLPDCVVVYSQDGEAFKLALVTSAAATAIGAQFVEANADTICTAVASEVMQTPGSGIVDYGRFRWLVSPQVAAGRDTLVVKMYRLWR